jgi:hypothetical protein
VKGLAYATILALVLLSVLPRTPARAGEVESTTRATSARRTANRVTADLGAVLAVAVDARAIGGEDRTTFGLEAGPLVFGPVHLSGLHRLLRSPLGFAPRSAVYGEATGLRLDTSLDPTSRMGGELELANRSVGVSVFEDADGRTGALALRLGAASARDLRRARPQRLISPSSLFGIELITTVSDVRARPAGDSWYPDEPGFEGGLLVHGGIRARLSGLPAQTGGSPAADEASGGRRLRLTGLDVSLFGSSGTFARRGGGASIRAEVSGPLGRAGSGAGSIALGLEQPWYRNRMGERPSERAAARVSLAGEGELLRARVDARSVVGDRPLEVGAEFPRQRSVAPSVEVGAEAGPYGEAAALREWLRDSDGERRLDGEVEVGLGYRQERVRTGVEIRRRWEGAEYEDAVRGELTLGGAQVPPALRFTHWIRVRWPDGVAGGGSRVPAPGGSSRSGGARWQPSPPEAEGAAGISLRPGPVSISLRAGTERPIEFSRAGRRALEEAPFEYLSVRLEVRLRVAVADLDAQHESGYLEVYGKPDNVNDGGHERAGHDGGVESEAMDEKRRDHPDDR